ncbi:MAG TPA: hypothetical protein VFV84_12495 [Burkholderiales bacterium]|nr:hypothetical protein [Burkholderiales bacterium]
MRRLALALLALGLFSPTLAGAQQFGRLFFTPEQREALDARRKAGIQDRTAPLAISPTTRLDGVVTRSQGKSTVWLDGNPIPDGVRPEGVRVRRSGDPSRVRIGIGEQGSFANVRVGQQVDRATGEIKDPIGPGELKVERGDPAKR